MSRRYPAFIWSPADHRDFHQFPAQRWRSLSSLTPRKSRIRPTLSIPLQSANAQFINPHKSWILPSTDKICSGGDWTLILISPPIDWFWFFFYWLMLRMHVWIFLWRNAPCGMECYAYLVDAMHECMKVNLLAGEAQGDQRRGARLCGDSQSAWRLMENTTERVAGRTITCRPHWGAGNTCGLQERIMN